MSHTPEPWSRRAATSSRHGDLHLLGPNGEVVARVYDSEHDARRIVACVNACAGINTTDLENVEDYAAAGIRTIASVAAERDAALAQVERLRESLTEYVEPQMHDGRCEMRGGTCQTEKDQLRDRETRARAALASLPQNTEAR